ncbi:hypothetical protein HDU83_002031 [Entophlyctis luteolus]|nr:hypothetical protein HDU83_002031 [Entophlyctis luteolus]
MDVVAGTTALLGSAAAGVFYFQPHRVVALLARQFPRIVWCLGANPAAPQAVPATPVSTPLVRSRSASAAPDECASEAAVASESLAWKEMKAMYFLSALRVKSAVHVISLQATELLRKYVPTSAPYLAAMGSEESAGSSDLAFAMEEGRISLDLREADVGDPPAPIPGVCSSRFSLTIDDSPSEYTAEILNILREHRAKATFFIIGSNVEALENGGDLLSRMVSEGHELANHTWHDRPTIRLAPAEFENELQKVDEMLQQYQPNPPVKWYRPGSGVFTEEMLDIAESFGYKTVLGCRFPVDTTSKDPRLNSWHVSSGIHPGAIVVLHDCRQWILETLRILLPKLSEKGYESVTLSTLFSLACTSPGEETIEVVAESSERSDEQEDGGTSGDSTSVINGTLSTGNPWQQ